MSINQNINVSITAFDGLTLNSVSLVDISSCTNFTKPLINKLTEFQSMQMTSVVIVHSHGLIMKLELPMSESELLKASDRIVRSSLEYLI